MNQLANTNSNVFPGQFSATNPPPVVATGDLTALPSLSGAYTPDPLEDIRVRAETVSILLKELMDRGSMRHWGINE